MQRFSTFDFESRDPGSNPGTAFNTLQRIQFLTSARRWRQFNAANG